MLTATVYLLTPKTEAAKCWLDENVASEAWQWLGDGLGIEHRYIEGVWQGIVDAGLEEDFELVS